MSSVVFYLGKIDVLESPDAVFDDEYEPSWLNSSLGKYIIKAIDESEVDGDRRIVSPVFEVISPDLLSCGCKSVLLAAFHPEASKWVFDGSKMGDNCYPPLFKVAKETNRRTVVRVGRLLREPWGEEDTVLFLPKKDKVTGYKACFDYLAMNTRMFYKGEGYGTQG